ncbi:MAG: hypothetical protein RJA09_2140 [Pseudomonadota bacterium]
MSTVPDTPFDAKLMGWVANALLGLFVAMGVVGVVYWAARHPAWTIAGVTVQGDVEHQNAATFRAHLASRLSGTFLTTDLQAVRQVFEAVPWVREAVVQREYPNRLKVTLREHQAVAWWGDAGGGHLVNVQGEVFEANPDDNQSDGWSELSGPSGRSAQVLDTYRQLRPVFERLELDIQRLDLDSRGGWRVRLDNGAVVELGRGDRDTIEARARLLVQTISQVTPRYTQDLQLVDMRYPNGYAVRLKGVTTLPDKPAGTSPKR